MQVSSVNRADAAYPMQSLAKPAAPTPPPDGNIENRQAPAEPQKPVAIPSSGASGATPGAIDFYA